MVKTAAKTDIKTKSKKTTARDTVASAAEVPKPGYHWMNRSNQWDTRVKPGKHGLRLGDLNVGIYGEIPEQWQDQTRNPRGAIPRKGVPPLGYSIRDKTDVWADSAADLYEEAIQRKWAPATDVPWGTVKPLNEPLERAICQVLTELCQYANCDVETISQWQHQMSYGYHEVKQYLATASFDAARMHEAFRKRALCNGGGLGLEGPGEVNRMILESRGGWSEAVTYLMLMRGTFTMTLLRYLEKFAYNDAEQSIYANALQAKARQMTYALEHLQYSIAHDEERKAIMATLLFIGDRIWEREMADHVLREALCIVFAGGLKKAPDQGYAIYQKMQRDFMRDYVGTCEWLGIKRDPAMLPEAMADYLEAS